MAGLVSESHILLGIIDEKIPSPRASFCVNKVGGEPDFDGIIAGNPKCEICNNCQALVVQVYCPLDDSPYHRTLYVFSCINASCWSKSRGWTVLRMLKLDETPKEACEKQNNLTAASGYDCSWGEEADDWGDGDELESAMEQDVEKKKQEVENLSDCISNMNVTSGSRVNNAAVKIKLKSPDNECVLESYYIDVFDESESVFQMSKNKSTHGISSGELENDDYSKFGGNCKIKPESYERTERKDEMFHKFLKKNQVCPEQIIRYSHNGQPLFARKFTGKVPHCSCGSPRVYEMQLMPALLPYLVLRDVTVEFSTVLIYTCAQNCSQASEVSMIKEHVIYQDDPDLSYFKGQKS